MPRCTACGTFRLPPSAFDGNGHVAYARRFEQRLSAQLDAEALAHARHDAHGEQRVAAEVEEIVLHADGIAAECLRPDRRHRLLGGAGRQRGPAHGPRRCQRRAVDRAVARERHRLHHNDVGGRRRRLCVGEMGAQHRAGDALARSIGVAAARGLVKRRRAGNDGVEAEIGASLAGIADAACIGKARLLERIEPARQRQKRPVIAVGNAAQTLDEANAHRVRAGVARGLYQHEPPAVSEQRPQPRQRRGRVGGVVHHVGGDDQVEALRQEALCQRIA